MQVLSIDQAANLSGWAFWDNDKLMTHGVIKPIPQSSRGGRRLASLRSQFSKLIDTHHPDVVVIEDPVGGDEDGIGSKNNWKTMQVLCQVQGILEELIYEKGKQIEIVSPSSWQNTLGIHRRARSERKAGAAKYILDTYSITPSQDEIDAICIGAHYIITHQEGISF